MPMLFVILLFHVLSRSLCNQSISSFLISIFVTIVLQVQQKPSMSTIAFILAAFIATVDSLADRSGMDKYTFCLLDF